MEKSRKDLINEHNKKSNIENNNFFGNASYYDSIIENIKNIDENVSLEDQTQFNPSKYVEESVIYLWVMASVSKKLKNLEKGEKITIDLQGQQIETIFSYYATKDMTQEDGQDEVVKHSGEEDHLTLYLGVNEKLIDTPGNENLKGMFRTSRYFQPALYRVSDFKLIRANGTDVKLTSIKF